MIKFKANKYQCNLISFALAMEKIKNKEIFLYAMSGKMGAGKDTIGDLIKKELEINNCIVKYFSYSYPMKKEIQEIINMKLNNMSSNDISVTMNSTVEEIETLLDLIKDKSIYERSDNSRLAIQYWGTNVRRKQNANYWINKLMQIIIQEVNQGNSVFVSDVRFENEANSILDLNGKILRLEVDEETRVKRIFERDNLRPTKAHLYHSSELALDNYKFDKIFDGSLPATILTKQAMNYIMEENNE